MRRMSAIVGVAMVVMAGGIAHGAAVEMDAAVFKEAQADLAAGKFDDCLRKVTKLLAHTSALEQSADRGRLLTLKGECLLVQKDAAAAEAYRGAIAAFPAGDAKEAAVAGATSELIKRSPGFEYTPKIGDDRKPIGIVDAKSRAAAFAAMFKDELEAQQQAMKPLMKGNATWQAMLDFSAKLRDLWNMEIVATGGEEQSSTMQKDLAAAAKLNLSDVIMQMNKQLDTISTESVKQVTVTTGTGNSRREKQQARGLTPNERTAVGTMISTMAKIPVDTRTLHGTLFTEDDFFKKELEDAKALKAKAEALLKANKVK